MDIIVSGFDLSAGMAVCQWTQLSLNMIVSEHGCHWTVFTRRECLSLGTVVTGCDYLPVVANNGFVFDSLKSIWSLSGRLLYLVSVVLVVVSLCLCGLPPW